MAVVRFGPIVQSASGALGSVVFARQGGTGIVRQRPLKVDQSSEAQLGVRANYQRAVSLWRGLSDDERDAWFRCAQIYGRVQPGGEKKPMSAWLVFAMVALRMLGTPYAAESFWLTPDPLLGDMEKGTVRVDVWPGGPVNFVHSRGVVYYPFFGGPIMAFQLFAQRPVRVAPGWPGQRWASVYNDMSMGYVNNVRAGVESMSGLPGIGERVRWHGFAFYPAWPARSVFNGVSVVPNVSGELVTNGDMELPVSPIGAPPQSWTLTDGGTLTRVSTDRWGDVASMRWVRTAGSGVSRVKTIVGINLGTVGTYVLRFAARCVAGGVWNGMYYANDVGVFVLISGAALPADGVWHEYEYAFVTTAAAPTSELRFRHESAGASEIYLDNVSVRRNL